METVENLVAAIEKPSRAILAIHGFELKLKDPSLGDHYTTWIEQKSPSYRSDDLPLSVEWALDYERKFAGFDWEPVEVFFQSEDQLESYLTELRSSSIETRNVAPRSRLVTTWK